MHAKPENRVDSEDGKMINVQKNQIRDAKIKKSGEEILLQILGQSQRTRNRRGHQDASMCFPGFASRIDSEGAGEVSIKVLIIKI